MYVPNLSEIGPAAAELLTINDRFFVRFRGCSTTAGAILKTRGPICYNLVGILSDNRYTQSLKMVKISYSVSKLQRLKVERLSLIHI